MFPQPSAHVLAAAFTIVYQLYPDDWIGLVVTGALGILVTASMQFTCKQYNRPVKYGVPLFPWVPALSVGLNTFLLGQLNAKAYERFGIWTAVCVAIYVFYGMHAAADKDKKTAAKYELEKVAPYNENSLTDAHSRDVAMGQVYTKH